LISRTSIAQPAICCRTGSGIDLIVKFASYHWFWSQWIYYITIDVFSYEHGAEKILNCQTFRKRQPYSNEQGCIQGVCLSWQTPL